MKSLRTDLSSRKSSIESAIKKRKTKEKTISEALGTKVTIKTLDLVKKTSLANNRGEVSPENGQPKKRRRVIKKEPETFEKEDFIQQNALGPACELWMGKGNPKPFRIIFAGTSTMGKTTMAVDIISETPANEP